MLENPVYTGYVYWNRLDFRASKQGEGPLVRRDREEWISSETPSHRALVSVEDFEKVQREIRKRSGKAAEGGLTRRKAPAKRFYQLRGIVFCATGHNPMRMYGKSRKGHNYMACGYRLDYGDSAAEALGHGKWQYVREEPIVHLIDSFFATRIFGPERVNFFRQGLDLRELTSADDQKRKRLNDLLKDIEQRTERQVAAIEAGVDPAIVGDRLAALSEKRGQVQDLLDALEADSTGRADVADSEAVLEGLPDLSGALATARPELRKQVFDAFRLRVEIDKNSGEVKLKATVSSAFGEAKGLDDLSVTNKAIAGAGFEPATFGL